ncbi:MAG: DUF2384 domain-containing protein [Ferruginibacter sp.]|nr:DUF2384 domain-containing protein [Cytophagales bacterium]
MGDKAVVKGAIEHPSDLLALTEQGLPIAALKSLQNELGLTNKEVTGLMGLSESTLIRRYKPANAEHRLTRDETDKLIHVAKVVARGLEVYGEAKFGQWIRSEVRALGNRKPLDLLWSSLGREQILELLIRIEHGMYS